MDKRQALVDYFMYNMLDNPETIRDALTEYFDNAHEWDVADLYKDLIKE